ncbi:MAG: Decaprenyl-phosphate phosphoribosyltransferase [uncultured Sulfurimonas sp.]|nr:MAG: Decaprenyl-phosphate phosphoribosyltransferase [uncultured Sulfurimonas sp.]CAI6149379.1 MAG: Decaprenyl-phosphate phosphoribosyltransferase [uncultured Sulfurimonas sp.]
MNNLITLLRPHQYVKNLFVFAPLIFAFNFNQESVFNATIAFILFSLLASSIYVLNDFMDIEEDKKHPTKKNRPLASGAISLTSANFLFLGLSSSTLIVTYIFSHELFAVLVMYFVLNILYSYRFKHIAIVDIFIIATGFVLRLFAGAQVTDTTLSMWIIIITFLLAIFLALAKRRDDVLLSIEGKETRKNIDGYNLEFVNAAMVLMSGVVILSYLQYTVSPEVIARIGSEYLYLTTMFVILAILRYMQITFVEQQSGSPSKIVLKDTFIKITLILWLISFVGIAKFL